MSALFAQPVCFNDNVPTFDTIVFSRIIKISSYAKNTPQEAVYQMLNTFHIRVHKT